MKFDLPSDDRTIEAALKGRRKKGRQKAMSIAGVLSSNLLNFYSPSYNSQASSQSSFQSEFQQLGQDLQAGNLPAAQADFAALQQNAPSAGVTSSSGNPIASDFTQLGKDLQAGNLTGAQQDFSRVQQDLQNQTAQVHHHHHHRGGGAGSGEQANLAQEFAQLGQELQSGNISAAQQAYSAVQQSLQAFGTNNASPPVQATA